MDSEGSLGNNPPGLKPPDKNIAKTIFREVHGYEKPNLVSKRRKQGVERRAFPSAVEAISEIRENEQARSHIRGILQQMGAKPDMVPSTQSVLHVTPDVPKRVTYTEAQGWFRGAKPLVSFGVKIGSLPRDSLVQLKKLFQANVKLWSEEGKYLEIYGTNDKRKSIVNYILRGVLPLFYSENIVIDQTGTPRLVDVEKFEDRAVNDNKKLMIQQIGILGCRASVGLLNLMLAFKRDKSPQGDTSRVMVTQN